MQRRNFLLGNYTLACFADTIPQRKDWERIAPRKGAKTSDSEPHLAVVELETDLLVAGGGLDFARRMRLTRTSSARRSPRL